MATGGKGSHVGPCRAVPAWVVWFSPSTYQRNRDPEAFAAQQGSPGKAGAKTQSLISFRPKGQSSPQPWVMWVFEGWHAPGPWLRFAETPPLGSWGHADLQALSLCQSIWPTGEDPSSPLLFSWASGHMGHWACKGPQAGHLQLGSASHGSPCRSDDSSGFFCQKMETPGLKELNGQPSHHMPVGKMRQWPQP